MILQGRTHSTASLAKRASTLRKLPPCKRDAIPSIVHFSRLASFRFRTMQTAGAKVCPAISLSLSLRVGHLQAWCPLGIAVEMSSANYLSGCAQVHATPLTVFIIAWCRTETGKYARRSFLAAPARHQAAGPKYFKQNVTATFPRWPL